MTSTFFFVNTMISIKTYSINLFRASFIELFKWITIIILFCCCKTYNFTCNMWCVMCYVWYVMIQIRFLQVVVSMSELGTIFVIIWVVISFLVPFQNQTQVAVISMWQLARPCKYIYSQQWLLLQWNICLSVVTPLFYFTFVCKLILCILQSIFYLHIKVNIHHTGTRFLSCSPECHWTSLFNFFLQTYYLIFVFFLALYFFLNSFHHLNSHILDLNLEHFDFFS